MTNFTKSITRHTMASPCISVVIATCDRPGLLKRTLGSLADADVPSNVRRIIIAENGAAPTAQQIVKGFSACLPVQYQFSSTANKSHALNQILAETRDEFLVFLDDDVRIHHGTLATYANAVIAQPSASFFGGRCLIDYEEAPPNWLLKFLPASATGWDLGNALISLEKPSALGANWGAYATHLREAGGFNERRGPGSLARGQETEMQKRLIDRGVCGYYLPDALVWHWVPTSRCSPDWCRIRRKQMSLRDGADFALRSSAIKRLRAAATSQLKLAALRTLIHLAGRHLSEQMRFHNQYRCASREGFLEGLRLADNERRNGIRTVL